MLFRSSWWEIRNGVIDFSVNSVDEGIVNGEELKAMTGVVDHGLFNGMVNKVIVAGRDGVKVVEVKA